MSLQVEVQNMDKVEALKSNLDSVLSLDASMPKLEELKVAQNEHTSFSGVISLEEKRITEVQKKASEFVELIKKAPLNSSESSKLSNDLYTLANNEIQNSGNLTNKTLDRPMKELKKGVVSSQAGVYGTLAELRGQVEALDPSKMDSFFTKIKVLGVNVPVPSFLPGVNKLKAYTEQWESAQSVLDSIGESLENSKDVLFKDIASMEVDKEYLVKSIENLEYYLVMAKELDTNLEALIIETRATDPEKAKFYEQEMLFPARQRVMDITQRIALNMQALLIFNGLVKTNRELVRGIDRSKYITLSALKTSVMTALALDNQRRALDQIEGLEKQANDLMKKSTESFKKNTEDIYKRSANAALDIEALKISFQNVYTTLDTIDNFKSSALGNMKELIETLEAETQKAKPYVQRAMSDTKN